MLQSLIRQLCAQRPDTPKVLNDLSKLKDQNHRPGTDTLAQALSAASEDFSVVYFVIDALDECPREQEKREQLLKTISEACGVKGSIRNHWMLTSRREKDIEASLQKALPDMLEVDLEERAKETRHDIVAFIEAELSRADYDSWPVSLKETARNGLLDNAQGM